MSKCMTIDETVDQKDICIDIAPKEIVEFILEEALLSVFIVSDKGCSRIGDSNITDEFRQQYDQISNQKDFEQVEPSQAQPAANKDSILNSRENLDRTSVQAKGNLEQIIHSFVKEEEKAKPLNDCQIISEDILADNELQIKNGQIHLEKNKTEKNISDFARQEFFDKKDVIKDEKIEIEYFNKGQLNRIYVPLNLTSSTDIDLCYGSKQKDNNPEKKKEELKEANSKDDTKRPFSPFTTEELRQVWENSNSSLVGRWEGNTLTQKQEVVRIMKELSSVQMFSDSFADPNRPRACAIGEEDVKKMTKEIEDMNFTQTHANSEDSMSCFSESQCVNFLSNSGGKLRNECLMSLTPSLTYTKNREFERDQKHDTLSSEVEIESQTYQVSSNITTATDSKEQTCVNNLENETSKEENKLNSGFSIQSQPESINDMNDSRNRRNSEVFQNETANLRKGDTHIMNAEKEELTLKDLNLTPDLEMMLIQEESSTLIKKSQNINIPLDVNRQTQQGTISWSGIKWGSKEAMCTLNSNSFLEEKHWERILVNYNPLSQEEEGKVERNDVENFLQEPQSWLYESKSNFGKIQNGEDADLNAKKINERLEEALINPKLEEGVFGDETYLSEAASEKFLTDDNTFDFTQTTITGEESQKTLNCENGMRNTESKQELSDSSQNSKTQVNGQTTSENELSQASETLVSGSQKFKLHSPKMYLSPYHEPAGQIPNEFNLTESEEAFIDFSENVIQVIDPPDNSTDEDSNVISFSLLPETTNFKSASPDNDTDVITTKSELSFKIEDFSESETQSRKVYSGMTTIGPIKNMDYDPKDLTASEIDYGKMTRITSSRQLARDMGLLNSENTALSVKIIEEDDSDDNTSLNIEDNHADRASLINRDIASLTKVQKVREVMSHQAKPEEEFEDEESLPRPRLDLKDVESMTDERYKFPDVSIPLLSLDIADRNMDAEKELIESMGLVISGLTNACFYQEELEDNIDIQKNYSSFDSDNNTVESSSTNAIDKQNSKTESLNVENIILNNLEKEKSIVEFVEKIVEVAVEDGNEKEVLEPKHSRMERKDEGSENQKYSTLGNVFRKASSKFMKKDNELYIRNSKSLPRDTLKITATNSIRSILDDCQSSATNMLKKSRSLLKNTENIFKSISQSMVATDRSSDSNPNQKKLSPSESDVSTIERKFSGFFKKEDFTKAKNIIKSKVEKTFKNSDVGSFPNHEPEIVPAQKDLRVVVKNEDNLRIDRIENFKKLLPKSPLVYKSQFVKSQMNFQSPPETEAPVNPTADPQAEETVNNYPVEDKSGPVPVKDKEFPEEPQPIGIYSQENIQWVTKADDLKLQVNENSEPQQPDFIVMETIQGLPASDLESPSSEKENLNVENSLTKKAENDLKKIEASKSLQILTDSSRDIAPSFPETDEEKMATKTPSERKIKTKKKKFTARFRSFWCSAFGRAKTPPNKGDLS